jgi:hypothetical protein
MKNRPVGAQLFHADGRTDGQTDLNDTNDEAEDRFSKAPKVA